MHGQLLRGLIPLVLLGCVPDWSAELVSDDPLLVADAFVHHRSFRRAALHTSLREPVREYGALRLGKYGRGWDALPVYNPGGLPEALPTDPDALRELGRLAFTTYPMQPSRRWFPVFDGETRGMDPETFVEVPVGDVQLPAQTCATCHSAVQDGVRVLGMPNPSLDLGADRDPPWRIGTVDPTPDGIDNPTTVGDLRPVRWQSALHWSGTLSPSLAALAVRVDTLLITSADERSRPPRVVPMAIAAFLWSLDQTLPEPDLDHPGAEVFAGACAGCHDLDGPADPVPVEVVGTDPAAADSLTRGTGRYRVPSLRGVGSRAPLLHDGSMPSLQALFDEERIGHRFGSDLPPADQIELVEWLGSL